MKASKISPRLEGEPWTRSTDQRFEEDFLSRRKVGGRSRQGAKTKYSVPDWLDYNCNSPLLDAIGTLCMLVVRKILEGNVLVIPSRHQIKRLLLRAQIYIYTMLCLLKVSMT